MRKLVRRLWGEPIVPPRPRFDRYLHLPVDEMSNVRLHEALAPVVQNHSAMQNFEPARQLTWVENSHPPVRPVLTLEKMKGGVLWPIYGLSIDFVPTVVGSRTTLKIGPKGVKLDVRIDPRDHGYDIAFFWGADAALQDMRRALPIVLARATSFWSNHQTVSTLADAVRFEEEHTKKFPGLGVENYVQAGFARPYLLAAAGHGERAKELWKVQMDALDLSEAGRAKAQQQFEHVLRNGL